MRTLSASRPFITAAFASALAASVALAIAPAGAAEKLIIVYEHMDVEKRPAKPFSSQNRVVLDDMPARPSAVPHRPGQPTGLYHYRVVVVDAKPKSFEMTAKGAKPSIPPQFKARLGGLR